MRLIHYTDEKFSLERKQYDQKKRIFQDKPVGFWVSVEGERDWKSWCKDEGFELENLNIAYEVKMKENAEILYLKTADEIFDFANQYPYLRKQWDDPIGRRLCETYEIDWEKVKEKYQGIIIAPYQWACRLSSKSFWYYGWDCASGCLWDLECIQELILINEEVNCGSV